MNSTTRNILIGLVAAIVIIAGGIFWAMGAQTAYASDVANLKKQLADAHAAQQEDFKSLSLSATNADVAKLIQQSENRFKDILAKAPQPQPILWLPFVADDVKRQGNDLRSTTQDLETALRNLRQYIAYEGEASAVIRDVTSQQYVSLSGQEALAAKWADGTKKLESLQKPAGSEQALNAFIDQYKSMQNTISAMIEATKKGDFNAYKQRDDEFTRQLGELRTDSRAFADLARGYDEAVTKAYDKLGDLTK